MMHKQSASYCTVLYCTPRKPLFYNVARYVLILTLILIADCTGAEVGGESGAWRAEKTSVLMRLLKTAINAVW